MSSRRRERLSGLLIRYGRVTAEEVERARLHPQAATDGLVGGLQALGIMSEREYLSFVAEKLQTEEVDLDTATLDPALGRRLTFELCFKYEAVPVRIVERTLVVAMCDPGDLHALDDLRFRAGMNMRAVVAGRRAVLDALRRLFPEQMAAQDAEADPVARVARTGQLAPVEEESATAEKRLRQRYREALGSARRDGRPLDDPALDLSSEDQIVIRLCHELLYTAAAEELSHVRLQMQQSAVKVAFRRGDAWERESQIPPALRARILWHLKGLCELPHGPVRRPLHAATPLQAVGTAGLRWIRLFIVPCDDREVVLLSPVPPEVQFRVSRSTREDSVAGRRWWQTLEAGRQARQDERLSQAETLLRQAVAAAEELGLDRRLELGDTLVHLGQVLDAAGRPSDARPIFERALRVLRSELGPDSPQMGRALTGLADVLLQLGRREEALRLYRQALLLTELAFGSLDLEVAWLMDRVGWICADQGNAEDAEGYAQQVQHVLSELAGVDRQDVLFE